MASDLAVMAFKLTPEERRQLRALLILEGWTVQGFFDRVVKEKLAEPGPHHAFLEREYALAAAVTGDKDEN
jgi:hypothetical protein